MAAGAAPGQRQTHTRRELGSSLSCVLHLTPPTSSVLGGGWGSRLLLKPGNSLRDHALPLSPPQRLLCPSRHHRPSGSRDLTMAHELVQKPRAGSHYSRNTFKTPPWHWRPSGSGASGPTTFLSCSLYSNDPLQVPRGPCHRRPQDLSLRCFLNHSIISSLYTSPSFGHLPKTSRPKVSLNVTQMSFILVCASHPGPGGWKALQCHEPQSHKWRIRPTS